jgi:putative Mn2+ efflux pump MntP
MLSEFQHLGQSVRGSQQVLGAIQQDLEAFLLGLSKPAAATYIPKNSALSRGVCLGLVQVVECEAGQQRAGIEHHLCMAGPAS